MPAPMIAATASPALVTSSKRARMQRAACGLRRQLDGHLGDDRQQAFGTRDQREQIVARRIEAFAAELDDLAVDQHARAPGAHCARSGRTSGNARHRNSRRRCRRSCTRSATMDRVRSTGRALQLPRKSPDCARRAARPRCMSRGSMLRIRLNLASESTTPSRCGIAPPDSPVPAPRATTGTRAAWHSLRIATTCASSSGRMTACGCSRNSVRPSHSYGRVSSGAVSNAEGATISPSAATRVGSSIGSHCRRIIPQRPLPGHAARSRHDCCSSMLVYNGARPQPG